MKKFIIKEVIFPSRELIVNSDRTLSEKITVGLGYVLYKTGKFLWMNINKNIGVAHDKKTLFALLKEKGVKSGEFHYVVAGTKMPN